MTIAETASFLKAHDKYLVLTHRRPDGDTVGSAAALCRGLRAAGRTAFLFENPQITETYLSWVREYFAPNDFSPEFVVAVDIASEDLFPSGFGVDVGLCIDHHPSNTFYAENTVVMPGKASCGEVIFELLNELNDGAIDEETATLLYIAISTDTGCFCYGNTNAEALRAAASLIDLGAKNGYLNKLLFRSKSMSYVKLEGEISAGMEFLKEGQIAVATVTLDMMARTGSTEADCEDISSLTGRVTGVKVGITLRELAGGVCKISARTSGEVDANLLCSRFGGGGHKMAAGATIVEKPEKVKEAVLAALEEIWPK